jgi:hypothetical protein
MSFYDDSTLMFLAAGAAGKDGKADTIKPAAPNAQAPLFVTRGSNLTATRVDSNGLIEKGRENLLKDSNSFNPSGTAWNPTTAFTVQSGQEGYDGSNDAWLLNKINANNDYFQQRSIVGMSGNVITESIYAKAGTEVGLMLYNSNGYAHWNLSNGTLISEGGNPITSNIESVGNGWYRCSVTVDGDASYDRMMIKVVNSNAANSSGSIYIQDSQIELGLVATEYIESGATTGLGGILENEPRFNYPIGGGSPHLLLEPSRTNLIGQSEYYEDTFWEAASAGEGSAPIITTNYATSPEGVKNATRIQFDASSTGDSADRSRIKTTIAMPTDNVDYTQSFYIKSNTGTEQKISFLMDNSQQQIMTATSEWQRFDATRQHSGATGIYGLDLRSNFASTSDILVYAGQLEEGSYPTSYIPNHSGGSVSREFELVQTADVSSLNLIGQDEGVFFLDFEFLDGQTAENQNWIALESENGQERVLIYKSASSNNIRAYLSASNSVVFQANDVGAISPNTRYKIAFKYSTGSQAVYLNGIQKYTSTNSYTRASDLSRLKFNESNIKPSCRVHQAIVLTSGWDNLDLAVLTGFTNYYTSFSEMATALNYTIYE